MSAEQAASEKRSDVPSIFEWWGLTPDSTHYYLDPARFEQDFRVKYIGPGWYGAGRSTMLVVPAQATRENIWAEAYTGKVIVYYWDRPNGVPVHETFNAILSAPTRDGP